MLAKCSAFGGSSVIDYMIQNEALSCEQSVVSRGGKGGGMDGADGAVSLASKPAVNRRELL
jgi:hypothetical protein